MHRLNPAGDLSYGIGPVDVVSVIIPAYNAAPFIKDTLDSVFAQTYPHYQVIVVNDGSPDTPALEQVLQQYIHRITYLKQENRGLSGARNTGLRATKGSLVSLLDADDIWMPDYLEEQTRFLREHPEYDLVYCNARIFGNSVYDGKEYMAVCPSNGEATSIAIISRRCHVFVSVMARKEPLYAIGFDESLRSCEDFDCWIRFTAAGYRIGYHRKVLVLYRRDNANASLTSNPLRMAEYNIQVLTKSLALWSRDSEEVRLLLQAKDQKIAELETLRGKLALRNQDFPAAAAHLQTANSYYKSIKMSIVVVLLKRAPWLVVSASKLRSLLLRAYRDVRPTLPGERGA
jgi:glycosyltransferase involved in cell wall biosynthesis